MDTVSDFLSTRGLVHHQLSSYDDFAMHGIRRIVSEEACIDIGQGAVLRIQNVETVAPAVTPSECRLHDMTYEAPVYVTLRVVHPTRVDITARVLLLRLPVMIRSVLCNGRLQNECMQDPGGYFVIRGKERVLVAQERNAYNTIVTQTQTDGSVTAEMRSMSAETGHSTLTTASVSSSGRKFQISIPFITHKLPIGVVFKALGVVDEERIKDLCRYTPRELQAAGSGAAQARDAYERMLGMLCRESMQCQTAEDALAFIAAHTMHTTDKPMEYVRQVVQCEMFPHLGPVVQPIQNVWLLAQFVKNSLLALLGLRTGASVGKDHLANKRYDCAGTLIYDLLRTSYKRFVRSLAPAITKHNTLSISSIVSIWNKANPITKDIRYSFLTGSWGMSRNSYIKTGVSQVLTRLSYVSFVSHLRRINIFIGREVKNVDIRYVHQSSYGFIDPSETPEGACVGVQKNMALLAYVTLDTPKVHVLETLAKTGVFLPVEASPDTVYTHAAVSVNNILVGTTACPDQMIATLRAWRRLGKLEETVSVSYDRCINTVLVWCDAGRLYRPIVLSGAPTFVDVIEIESYVVRDGTDCHEVHPICIMGVTCNLIPFADHSVAPRICYYSSMSKQSLGVYATNHPTRFDTSAHLLEYTQQPIVSTRVARMIGYDRMSCGINCVVAVCTYTGYNQEDCVIVNKSAVDRGLFVSHAYRSLTVDEKKEANVSIQMFDARHRKPHYNYHKLDESGIVRKGMHVEPNDVMVSRIMKKKTPRGFVLVDYSVVVQAREEGIVDKVHIHTQADGTRVVKIRVRTPRVLELGDKLANVAAQKATVGLMLNSCDMPFTACGTVPDIIINPNALPSRMTISMLLEMVLGKTCALENRFGDATPFTESSTGIADRLCEGLQTHGFDGSGLEVMYNGMTGEQMQTRIFTGLTYYHKLKHLVAEKVYARGHGGVTLLTQQPESGRSKLGALRLGEMERDCVISQGCSALLVDRLYEASDKYVVQVCTVCSSPDVCPCAAPRVKARAPYAFRLLQQQLQAMAIDMRMQA